MNTQKRAVSLMIICTFFIALGQILWKFGVNKVVIGEIITYFNWLIILGFVSYSLGALFMLAAFKKGELSILYPLIATTYIWISIASPLFFPTDSMNIWKWLGVAIIFVSVGILGLNGGAKHG
tara:strand:+ start:98 stop:466 length:369 start_codon:yes stop_codon:yes gene_type:complete